MASSLTRGCSRLPVAIAAGRSAAAPLPFPRVASAASAFHTSAMLAAQPAKKKNSRDTGPKYRQSRSVVIKRKNRPELSKRPASSVPGELRALRSRVVLSNPNALAVPGQPELAPATTEQGSADDTKAAARFTSFADERLRGRVLALPLPLLDRLRGTGAFRPNQQRWALYRRPGVLVTGDSVELARRMGELEASKKVASRVVTGVKGSGKSVYLLQAMAMAMVKGWVVVTLPEGQDLVNAHTAYAPLPDTNPPQYIQKDATAKLLHRIANANGPVLSNLFVSRRHPSLRSLSPNTNLQQLAYIGADDASQAWPVFQALWAELTATGAATDATAEAGFKPFAPRPPLLVTADNVAHFMKESAYRSAKFDPVHAHDLLLVRFFLTQAAAATGSPETAAAAAADHTQALPRPGLPNGGLVLLATSRSNAPRLPTFDLLLSQLAARQSSPPAPIPTPAPYAPTDDRVLSLANTAFASTTRHELHGLDQTESRGLLEYLALSGLLRARIDERFVTEQWALAGGGVVGELERLGLRVMGASAPAGQSAVAAAAAGVQDARGSRKAVAT